MVFRYINYMFFRIQDFQETIGVPDSVKTFAKSELTLDFTSLRTVARNVPGFRYGNIDM